MTERPPDKPAVVGEPSPPTENDDECCRFHFLGGDKAKPHSSDPGKDVRTCCTFHYTGGADSAPCSQTPRQTRRTP